MYQRLMFWHVDEKKYNVDELVKTSDMMVEKAQERGVSPQDLILLRDAKKHMWVIETTSRLRISSAT